jgi:hypothetical protein
MQKLLCKLGFHDNDETLLDSSGGGSFAYSYTCKCCNKSTIKIIRYGK